MLETLVTSKTRVKLLLKFFLNPATRAYLRSLESEFGDSSNSIRLELNRFEKAGMLMSANEGNKKIFQVDCKHPLFWEIHNIIRKYIGIDILIEQVIDKLGSLDAVYLSGNLAKGINDNIVDLVIMGDIDRAYLTSLTEKTEKLIKRKIRYIVYSPKEYHEFDKNGTDHLLIYNQ